MKGNRIIGHVTLRRGKLVRQKPLRSAIERLTGEMVASGEKVPGESEEAFKTWFKESCEKELWFFSRWALGNDHLSMGTFHRREVCKFLTDFSGSRFKLLLIPMGCLKTTVASRSMPLHALVQMASRNIYIPGMNGANMRVLLANENSQKSKENLDVLARHAEENDWLYWLWPNVFWAFKKEAKRWTDEGFEVKRAAVWAEPSVKAIGMKTGFIGGYFDLIVADDIAALQASMDPPLMDRAKKFRRASMTRLANKRTGIHVGVGTHWGADDVYVEWKKDPRVETLVRSVVEFDEDQKAEVPLWPEKYPLDVIETMRKGMDPVEFALWYLNKPVASGFTALNWSDLREYVLSPDGRELYFNDSEMDQRIQMRYQTITRNLGFVLGSARYDPMNARPRGSKLPKNMDEEFVLHERLKYNRCEKCGLMRGEDGSMTCTHPAEEPHYGYRWLGPQ